MQPFFFRLAQALASSFNFQGRVRKTFYLLSNDKVVAGFRRQPQSQTQKAVAEVEAGQPMETDTIDTTETVSPAVAPQPAPGTQTLAAKLSANLAQKRKATDPPEQSGNNDKPKRR